MTADELNAGEKSRIAEFSDPQIEAKLLAMGILPGKSLEMIRKSVFGSTYYIKVDGVLLALRKEEAQCIQLK